MAAAAVAAVVGLGCCVIGCCMCVVGQVHDSSDDGVPDASLTFIITVKVELVACRLKPPNVTRQHQKQQESRQDSKPHGCTMSHFNRQANMVACRLQPKSVTRQYQ